MLPDIRLNFSGVQDIDQMEGFRSSLWLTFSLLVSNQLCSAAAAGNIWDSTNLATGGL